MKKLILFILTLFLFSCNPKIQERVIKVYESDTIEVTKTIRDTVFKEKLVRKTDTAFVFVKDTIRPVSDTVTVSSNYATAQACFHWPRLHATITDKDTTLHFRIDSARTVIRELRKKVKTSNQTETIIEEKPYVPWYIYTIIGLMAGVILFLGVKLILKQLRLRQ